MLRLGCRANRDGAGQFYTALSIKRGALQSAAVACDELGLDPRQVVQLGKHADHLALSPTTVQYLREYSVYLTETDTLIEFLGAMLQS
eukprot:gene4793-biopygen3278